MGVCPHRVAAGSADVHFVRRLGVHVEDRHERVQVHHAGDAVVVDEDVAGPGQVRPHPRVFAVSGKQLDPIVLPVAHHHPSVPVHPDAVRDVELSGPTLDRPSPRVQQPTLRREPVDPAVGVTVRNEQVPFGRQRDVRASIEGPGRSPHGAIRPCAAGVRGGIPNAHRHQRFAVQRTLDDGVGLAHRQIDMVLAADVYPVAVGQVLPPHSPRKSPSRSNTISG